MKSSNSYYGGALYLNLYIQMANGMGPYKYSLYWNGNYRDGKYYGSKTSFTVFDPGEYYIHVEDAVGRKIDSVIVTVTAPSN